MLYKKFTNRLLLLTIAIGLSACSMPAKKTPMPIEPVEWKGQSLESQVSQKAMYDYLLGQIAGVHSSIAEQQRQPEKAKALLEVAVPHLIEASGSIDDAGLAEHATKAATFSGDSRQAYDAASRWVQLKPDESRAHQYAALAALKSEDQEKAFEHFRRVISLAPTEDDGMLDVGMLLSREADKDSALTTAEALISAYPHSAAAHYVNGTVQLRYDKKAEGLAVLDKALAIQPSYRNAKLLKANVLRSQGKLDEGLAILQQEVDANPDDMELRAAYARMLISAKRYEAARDQYEALFKSNPNNTNLAFRLGMLTLELNQLDLAEKYFKHVLTSDKRTHESLFHLGRVAEMREDYQTALQYYMRVTEGEYRLEALLRESRMLALLGKPEDGLAAIDALQTSNTDAGMDVRLYLAKADIWVTQKNYQSAYDVVTEALQKHEQDFDLRFTRSMLSEKVGLIDESIADLEMLLAKQPRNADLLNALGYTLANRTQQYDRARELIEQAIQLKPDSAAIADSMGWVLFKQDELDEAERYIRKAYELDADPEIAAHLGEILWVKGKQKEAEAIWQKAHNKNPQHDALNQTIQRFQK